MGFNSVYRVLQEVFPRVDTRILRAVAIEHPKDVDTAVEVVLVEVIPYLSKGTTSSASFNESELLLDPSKKVTHDSAVEDAYHPDRAESSHQVDSTHLDAIVETLNGSSYNGVIYGRDQGLGYDGNQESVSLWKHKKSNGEVGPDVTSHGTPLTRVQENGGDDDCNFVNTKSEEINSLQELSSFKVESDQASPVSSTISKHDHDCAQGILKDNQMAGWEDFDGPFARDIHGESCQEQTRFDDNHLEVKSSVGQLVSLFVQDGIPDTGKGDLQLAVASPLNSDCEKPEKSGVFDAASKKGESASEMVDFVDESALNTVVTRSGKICRIDLLEDIIEDARNNKKSLFSAMESVISLMREVELQEKAAELAKEEAVLGGLGFLNRVEDLKQMLQHAQEANSMHAGEVYGERAILATEARELQSRLLSLSDERDKSLAILDEMRKTLEERLDAAEKERKAAELENMEKSESARNALAKQELIMEKVVQESKMLETEAEENAKLREFLMDRGRVVDMLQGEISVICKDVKMLKENFDERVPFSKSLSSSQTSCILASSSSSVKSTAPDQLPEQTESSETPKKTSPTPSVDDQLFSEGERPGKALVDDGLGDDRKALVDDGWEFFDNPELDYILDTRKQDS